MVIDDPSMMSNTLFYMILQWTFNTGTLLHTFFPAYAGETIVGQGSNPGLNNTYNVCKLVGRPIFLSLHVPHLDLPE